MFLESLYPYILPIHIASACVTALIILWADSRMSAWFFGKVETVEKSFLDRAHRYVWIGLCALITTGLVLFYPYRQYLLSQPLFVLKLMFVCTLTVNAFWIGSLMRCAETGPFSQLPVNAKAKILFSGAISFISWVGAFVAAFSFTL